MQELNQGESYEADATNTDVSDESSESTTSEITHIYGIPKNKFIIGVVILLVVILVIVMFVLRSRKEEEAYTPADDGAISDFVSDDSGEWVGGESDDSGEWVGGGSDDWISGDMQYGSDSSSDGVEDPFASSEEPTETNSLNSPQSIVNLRRLGYTGDEIELAAEMGLSYDTLVAEAERLRTQEAEQRLLEIQDHASPEYQRMYNYSVFSLPPITFEALNWDYETARNDNGSYVVNADYEKVPTYGNQLFLKVKIASDTYAFMQMTPFRWAKLPESGNIVLNVQYNIYGSTSPKLYITDITEVSQADVTVGPQDSDTTLSDIIANTSSNTYYEEEEPDDGQIWY